MVKQISIEKIGYYLPEDILTNNELSNLYPNWNPEKILNKTGIRERHISKNDETALDMAEKAALNLFKEYDIQRNEIEFIILCTQSPDYFLPTTACLLQERLHIPSHSGALDINLGCSGFIYGLALSKGLIISGICKNVLLVMSETYSKHIHPLDKSTRTIFGDGAAAVLVEPSNNLYSKVGEFVFGTDGKGANNLIVPAGGLRLPPSNKTSIEEEDEDGNIRSKNNLYMNGPEIFNFTIEVIPRLVDDTLKKNNLKKEDIDFFVFHQANKYILEFLRKKLKIPSEKFYINMEHIGNTVSASIPIALKMACNEGEIRKGDKVMIVGFGVGYSWGATIIQL